MEKHNHLHKGSHTDFTKYHEPARRSAVPVETELRQKSEFKQAVEQLGLDAARAALRRFFGFDANSNPIPCPLVA